MDFVLKQQHIHRRDFLAVATGAAVGVSNGWEEFTGLARLPADAAEKIIADVALL